MIVISENLTPTQRYKLLTVVKRMTNMISYIKELSVVKKDLYDNYEVNKMHKRGIYIISFINSANRITIEHFIKKGTKLIGKFWNMLYSNYDQLKFPDMAYDQYNYLLESGIFIIKERSK